jgi:uncharacterized phiE125 gp8 family phage protein
MNILGPLELSSAPSGLVVTATEAKSQFRVTISTDDTLIENKIGAATRLCESEISGGRQFLSATFDMPVMCWWDGVLKIPRPPLSSVTHIKYYATDGTLTTLSTSIYEVKTPWRAPGYIQRAPDQTWPAYQADRNFPIVIRFVAGFGAAAAVPLAIKEAILLTAGWLYENREATEWELRAVCALLESEGYGFYG